MPLLRMPAAHADAFWAHWGDGKAELAGYTLRISRYGQPRTGTLVLIFVTEDFSQSARVKADPGKHPPRDVFPVLKLNALRRFQTGIYEYSTMTSVFVRADALGALPTAQGVAGSLPALAKVSFSSQEWCGHVFHQVVPRVEAGGLRLHSQSHSYFDGEADDQRTLDGSLDALSEDELALRLRRYAGRAEALPMGSSRSVPLLSSLLRVRLGHQPVSIEAATIEHRKERTTLSTPAGSLVAFSYGVLRKSGEQTTYFFEEAAPHRLLGYRSVQDGTVVEEALLRGSTRLPYWQLNQSGHESFLKQLGL
ncbi:MAG: hypothetical protein JNJ46_01920 [Myxococcales bacterium]|nr:hypothetical protein [Myxococcales bacterium]